MEATAPTLNRMMINPAEEDLAIRLRVVATPVMLAVVKAVKWVVKAVRWAVWAQLVPPAAIINLLPEQAATAMTLVTPTAPTLPAIPERAVVEITPPAILEWVVVEIIRPAIPASAVRLEAATWHQVEAAAAVPLLWEVPAASINKERAMRETVSFTFSETDERISDGNMGSDMGHGMRKAGEQGQGTYAGGQGGGQGGYADQGSMGNQGMGNQGMGNQSMGNQGMGNQSGMGGGMQDQSGMGNQSTTNY